MQRSFPNSAQGAPAKEPYQFGCWDLSLHEISSLAKDHCYAVGACLLICLVFAVPAVLLWGLDFGLKSALPPKVYSGGQEILEYGVIAAMAYLVIWLLPDLLRAVGQTLLELANMTARMSKVGRAMFAVVVVGYLLAWKERPTAAFLLTLFVVAPGTYTYKRYLELLRAKSNPDLASSRSDEDGE